MSELVTIVIGVLSLILGWRLKAWSDTWTWRRQQVLDAYIALLDAADLYSLQASSLWSSGTEKNDATQRTDAWFARILEVRQSIAAVDRAYGKLTVVSGWGGARAAGEMYLACEVMFRRAIASPPSTLEHYQEAADAWVNTYGEVVEHARKEMGLRHWRERLPGRESNFEFMQRRMERLNESDPLPSLKRTTPTAKEPTTPNV
jgi:hypothetical protein